MTLNTVAKGDAFEAKALTIINKLIEDEILYLPINSIRITPKAKLFSRDRKKDIIFDLTIEVWPPNADRYSMIYIIECKDYKNRVPISKVEDFHSKIQQVTGVNVKGIFITNSPLQEAAYNFAESKGMMVIQADATNTRIVLYRKSRVEEDFKIPLISDSINTIFLDEGVIGMSKVIDQAILKSFSNDVPKVPYGIDKLNKKSIEEIANLELNKMNPEILPNAQGITFDMVEKYLREEYGIIINELPQNANYLGSCNIIEKTISIHPNVKNTVRHLFVLCHEFGHFLLHQKLTIDQISYDFFEDSKYDFQIDAHPLDNPKRWIEWQANYFAASFILNKESLLARIFDCQNKLGLTKDALLLTDDYNSYKTFNAILIKLVNRFNTSKTTLIYIMKEHNFLKEKFRTKSAGQLIKEFEENYFA
jgi:Zn-dependent peptidase ImmA (M78 family)